MKVEEYYISCGSLEMKDRHDKKIKYFDYYDMTYFAESYAKQAIKDMLDVSDEQIEYEASKTFDTKSINFLFRANGMKAFRDKLKEQTNGTD